MKNQVTDEEKQKKGRINELALRGQSEIVPFSLPRTPFTEMVLEAQKKAGARLLDFAARHGHENVMGRLSA